MPSPGDPLKSPSRHLLRDWWKRAEKLAGLAPKRGRGWHALRRKFATELSHAPPKDLCELGGWKDYNTIMKCYLHPDLNALATTLQSRSSQNGSDPDPQRAQFGPVREAEPETPKLRLIP